MSFLIFSKSPCCKLLPFICRNTSGKLFILLSNNNFYAYRNKLSHKNRHIQIQSDFIDYHQNSNQDLFALIILLANKSPSGLVVTTNSTINTAGKSKNIVDFTFIFFFIWRHLGLLYCQYLCTSQLHAYTRPWCQNFTMKIHANYIVIAWIWIMNLILLIAVFVFRKWQSYWEKTIECHKLQFQHHSLLDCHLLQSYNTYTLKRYCNVCVVYVWFILSFTGRLQETGGVPGCKTGSIG